jgi:hypothetical protein
VPKIASRPLIAAFSVGIVGALTLAGCGGESPSNAEPVSSPTTTPTTSAIVTPTTFPPDQSEPLRQAVISYWEDQGIGPTFVDVRNLVLSSADPSWARFNVAPTPGNDKSIPGGYQGGFGVAHFDGTRWAVVDFGTANVGCASTEVPPGVRDTLSLGCPTG